MSPISGVSRFIPPPTVVVVVVVVDVDVADGCSERSCCWHQSNR